MSLRAHYKYSSDKSYNDALANICLSLIELLYSNLSSKFNFFTTKVKKVV